MTASVRKSLALALLAFGAMGAAQAALLNGTGLVTPDVIYGNGGNDNGSFTGQTANNIEVGLRAHQRYPTPENVFNYDGVSTYTFASGGSPVNRSVFNFDWAINVDQSGTSGNKLSAFDYRLSFDTDTTAATNYITIDPFNTAGYFDHSLGTNATGSNAGTEFGSLLTLQAAMASFNVAQQSSNLGFGFSADPDAPGIYSFRLEVLEKGTANVLSSSEIQVVVAEPVPAPQTLALVLVPLGIMMLRSRRKA